MKRTCCPEHKHQVRINFSNMEFYPAIKKQFILVNLFMAIVLCATMAKAQNMPAVTTMTTAAPVGTDLSIVVESSVPFAIDWGDGTKKNYAGLTYIQNITEKIKGSIITIYGDANKITGLLCSKNQLTSLDITKNKALTILQCINNQLSELDVSKNTMLTDLACSNNQLTSLDISQNKDLTKLVCSGNQITTLNVSLNTALTSLSCENNKISALDISNCPQLSSLWCGANQLTNIDITNNMKINELHCPSNKLNRIEASNNSLLIALDIKDNLLLVDALNSLYNQLPDINAVTVWPNETSWKKRLSIFGNPGTMASTTTTATNKGWICDIDGYIDLQVISMSTTAAIGSNMTFEIKATAPFSIDWGNGSKKIYSSDNQLITGKSSGNNITIYGDAGKLTMLNCSNNQLISLDISNSIALERLDCHDNQLTALDITKNSKLKALNARNNRLDFSTLNKLYSQLPDLSTVSSTDENDWEKRLLLIGNPKALSSIYSTAIKKGWICDLEGYTDPDALPTARLEAWPNPFSNQLTVRFDWKNTGGPARMEIYSIQGSLINTIPLDSREKIIALPFYAKGLYLFKVIQDERSWSEILIRE